MSHPRLGLDGRPSSARSRRGGDRVLVTKLARKRGRVRPPELAAQTLRRFVRERKRVGLSLVQLPVALSLAALYYGVAIAGALATVIRPEAMTRRARL